MQQRPIPLLFLLLLLSASLDLLVPWPAADAAIILGGSPVGPSVATTDGRLQLGDTEAIQFSGTGFTCTASGATAQFYASNVDCVAAPTSAAAGGTARDSSITGCTTPGTAGPTSASFTFSVAGTYKLCYSQPDTDYKMIDSGVCTDIGCLGITDTTVCDAGALVLNLEDQNSVANNNAAVPKGCYQYTNPTTGNAFLYVNGHGTGSGTAAATHPVVCDCRALPDIYTAMSGTFEVATELPSAYSLTPIVAGSIVLDSSQTAVQVTAGKGLVMPAADEIKVVNSVVGCGETAPIPFIGGGVATFATLTPTSTAATVANTPLFAFAATGTFAVCYKAAAATSRYATLISTGRCADTTGCVPITGTSTLTCAMAASMLGLSDTTAGPAGSATSPPGCYFDGTDLFLNTDGTGSAASTAKQAVCDCVGASAYRTIGTTFTVATPHELAAAPTGAVAPALAGDDTATLTLVASVAKGLAADAQVWLTIPTPFQAVTATPTVTVDVGSGAENAGAATATGTGPWTVKVTRAGTGTAVATGSATSVTITVCCLKNPPYEVAGGQALYTVLETRGAGGHNLFERYDSSTHANPAATTVIVPGTFAAGPSIVPLTATAAAPTSVLVSFTPRSPIPVDGELRIGLPTEYSSVTSPAATASTGMDGGLAATVSGGTGGAAYEVRVVRDGAGTVVASNTPVVVTITGVVCPPTAGVTGTPSLFTAHAGGTVRVDLNAAVAGTELTPALFGGTPSLVFAEPVAGDLTSLAVSIVPSIALPANGTIELEFDSSYTFDTATLATSSALKTVGNATSHCTSQKELRMARRKAACACIGRKATSAQP